MTKKLESINPSSTAQGVAKKMRDKKVSSLVVTIPLEDKFQILYYLARTHEAIASTRIFEDIRQKIGRREIGEYIEQTKLKSFP